MKLALLLIALSFLIFTFTAELSLAKSDDEPVVDTNGDPIVPGSEYYMVSAIFGAGGGGVRPGRTGNSKCPVSVIQERSDLNYGNPVKFTIPRTSLGTISPGTPLEIAFANKPHCAESSNWVIVRESNKEYVAIGGAEDHPDEQEFLSGHFEIEKFGGFGFGTYKLVFCPRANGGSCSDIGRVSTKGIMRLVLTDENPFPVVFVPKRYGKSKI